MSTIIIYYYHLIINLTFICIICLVIYKKLIINTNINLNREIHAIIIITGIIVNTNYCCCSKIIIIHNHFNATFKAFFIFIILSKNYKK